MARQLGQLEVAALAYLQMRNIRAARTGDLAAALRITAKQERELLSRMARGGMIAKVRNGLYLFPAKLPLGGVWTPDAATAISALIADKQATYEMEADERFLRKLQRALRRSTAKIPFVPNRPTRGPFCRRWGVVINA